MRTKLSLVVFISALLSACASTQANVPAAATPATETSPATSTAPSDATQPSAAGASSSTGHVAHCEGGSCKFDLTLAFTTPAEAELHVARCPRASENCGENVARFTEAGVRELQALRDTLAGVTLDARYGCPGCADGPRRILVLPHDNGPSTEHLYDPMRMSELPKPLQDANELLNGAVRAVMTCQPTPQVELVGECKH